MIDPSFGLINLKAFGKLRQMDSKIILHYSST